MSLQNVRTELLRYSAAEAVVVNAALIGSDSVVALWKSVLGIQEITIKNPRVSESNSGVIVTGKASFLNVAEMPIEMAFEDDHGTVPGNDQRR
jgi:hypothetical protein